MIVKKVKSSGSRSKGSSIRALTNYITGQDSEREKIVYSSGRGFICDDFKTQQAEMVALASESVRSKNPVTHYIMSWREGEQPSSEQVEQGISIFMEELGLKGHQSIYALHKDTDNIHLHIAVNRVHPKTLKVVEINKGFDIETAHRAIARIEHVQGWQPPENARYKVLENGDLVRGQTLDAVRQPSQKKRDMEHRTGEKSAERIAIENVPSILKRVSSWQELHAEFGSKNLRYEKTGSGATIFVGDIGVKASSADREASLSKLQKRFGVYEPSLHKKVLSNLPPEPIKKDMLDWDEFITSRKKHYADKSAAVISCSKKHDEERLLLSEKQKKQRIELLEGNWKGKGDLRNAMQSVIAAEQASEKLTLKENHRKERTELSKKYPAFPELEEWYRMQKKPHLAEQWRHRASEPQHIEGPSSEPPKLRDIRDYVPEIIGQHVHYTQKKDVGLNLGSSFTDKGKVIDIHDWRNRETTLAALQLSAQKWDSFQVTGNDEYKLMCAKLAAQHGFKINNIELQAIIKEERERMNKERIEASKSEQLKQFEKYHEAVGADRYRVTSIRMKPDGGKMTFILDKKDGITQGFSPSEIAQKTSEMKRLQKRGENLYYTPLSGNKHHILIDDMTRENLKKFIDDGYKPAIVIESSPGNYQAIITVKKLGTVHDREIETLLAEKLNQSYGDPHLFGYMHPHYAPGYENHKLKHQRPDGSSPEVKLLRAEYRECSKTLDLASEIVSNLQRTAFRMPQNLKSNEYHLNSDNLSNESKNASNSVLNAYEKHKADILKRQQGGTIDLSRVDSMIAVRMRVTGHPQLDIEKVLSQCAPQFRKNEEGRDWGGYVQRAVRYAYSAAGDRKTVELEKYRQQWEKLEGREPAKEKQIRPERGIEMSR